MMITRSLRILLTPALLAAVAGCEQQSAMVYVLEEPQSVTLTASASALRVQQGETVVLRAQRSSSGKWKQIRRDELSPGQCWVYRPSTETAAEVADNVHWQVVPENSVRLNTEYRMDHTRIATMMIRGTITLTPISAVKCEEDRAVEGPVLQIEVI